MMGTKNNWIKSTAINLIVLIAALICTRMLYETNDDYAIASRIADGYAYVNFVNYYLCKMLIMLQKLAPTMNAYIIGQIFASFVSFVCILKLILDAGNNAFVHIVASATLLIFAFDHYASVQFTKTAAILIIAGMMLMIDSITNKRNALYYILSIVLLYVGVAFRIDGLIAVVGFAGLYLLDWIVENRKRLVTEGFITRKKFVVYAMLLALIGGCYAFDNLSYKANVSTDDLREYKTYSEYRSEIVDYPLFEYYDNNADEYAAINISKNDLFLIDHWVFDYDGAASVENLKKIVAVDNADERPSYSIKKAVRKFEKKTLSAIKKLTPTGVHIIILTIIAFWMMASIKPKKWLYIMATGAFTMCLYIALYYMQRPEYRAMYIADAGACFWLLYAMSRMADNKAGNVNFPKFLKIGSIVVLAVLLIGIVPLHDRNEKDYSKIVSRQMSAELSQYIEENDDCFFVFAPSGKRNQASYLCPWKAPDTEAGKNVMGTGSWGTKSPYVLTKLTQYGMSNPVKDLIDNPKAFYVGDTYVEKLIIYYNKWYGAENKVISMEKTETVNGINIYRVVSQTS